MEEPSCPVTPPLSRCSETPPPAGGSKSSPSRWDEMPSCKDKSRTPTPNRPSSPENCAICLGPLTNKSFTNSCCHQFCFVCLLEWSKVKAECPLCKVAFDSIIHNVRSQDDYDQYHVVREAPTRTPALPSVVLWTNTRAALQYEYTDFSEWMANRGIGRYRSTNAGFHNSLFSGAIPHGPPTYLTRAGNPNGTSAFRRSIYQRDLWARLQPDVTGRYRECSPEFYSQNPAQLHRLVPFLNRELNVLLDNPGRTAYVMDKILELLPACSIQSNMFRTQIAPLIGHQNAPHFCHELRAFASSPYDMVGYDRAVQYHPNGGAGYSIELDDDESSDGDASDPDDDDVLIIENESAVSGGGTPTTSVSAFASTSAAGSAETATRSNFPPRYASTSLSLIPHTSVVNVSSDSDSDIAEDVQIVGYVKPRHERTPEIITLSSPEHPGRSSSQSAPVAHVSSLSPELPDDLICINLGNNSSVEHKWHNNLDEISSDDASSPIYSSTRTASQRLRKPVKNNLHFKIRSSSDTSKSSSSEEDERKKKHSKHRKSKKGDKSKSRKHSKHLKDNVQNSDNEDDSQPSTSRGRSRRRERRDSNLSSPKSTSCSKNSTLSRSTVCSGSDHSSPRTSIRSAIVRNSYSRRYSSSDDMSPSHASGAKLRNIIMTRTTTDEGHDSWRVSETNATQDGLRNHRGKHERHRSRHSSHSKKKKSSRGDRKRRERSRSPEVHSKILKRKMKALSYSDDSDSP